MDAYKKGDHARVTSDEPRFGLGLGHITRAATEGDVVKIVGSWQDGDYDYEVVGRPNSQGVINERFLAPVFAVGDLATVKPRATYRVNRDERLSATGRRFCGQVVRVVHGPDGDGDLRVEGGDGTTFALDPRSLEPYQAPLFAIAPDEVAIAGIDEDDEPEALDPAMERRADALEAALDILGDDKSVGEYVEAALFLLGEEVPS